MEQNLFCFFFLITQAVKKKEFLQGFKVFFLWMIKKYFWEIQKNISRSWLQGTSNFQWWKIHSLFFIHSLEIGFFLLQVSGKKKRSSLQNIENFGKISLSCYSLVNKIFHIKRHLKITNLKIWSKKNLSSGNGKL